MTRGFGYRSTARRSLFDVTSAYALYLPFSAVTPTYRSGTTKTNTLSALPGYSYTRSGATKLETEFLGYGDELVANGGFDSDTVWSKSPGTSISGGTGVFTATASGQSLYQSSGMVTGTTYRVTYSVVSISAGGTQISLGGNTGTLQAAVGTYTENVVCGAATYIAVQANGTTTATIDNVSVQQVYPQVTTTTLGAELVAPSLFSTGTAPGWFNNWVSSGGALTSTSVGTECYNGGLLTVGRTYRATITASQMTGNAVLRCSTATEKAFAVGSTTVNFVAGDGNIDIINYSGTTTVTSLSVKEVLHDGLSYLGPELVTNGDLSSGLVSPWSSWNTCQLSVVGGRLQSVSTINTDGPYINIPATTGRTYAWSMDIAAGTSNVQVTAYTNNFQSGLGSSVTVPAGTSQTVTGTFVNTGGSSVNLMARADTPSTFFVDNTSLKEVIPEAFITFPSNTPGIVPKVGYYSRAAVTNLVLQSQAFDDAAWAKNSTTVTANNALAPDGTLTADLVTSSVNGGWVTQHFNGATGTYTASVFAKAGSLGTVDIYIGGGGKSGGDGGATIDLGTGSVSFEGNATSITTSVTSVGNGWTRFALTFSLTGTGVDLIIRPSSTASGSVYLWQAQLVAGSTPGPIIPTTTATAAVGADAMSIGLANGSYDVVYTLGNGSTQTIPSTISSGSYAIPTYPDTIGTPAIRSITAKPSGALSALTIYDRAGAIITDRPLSANILTRT